MFQITPTTAPFQAALTVPGDKSISHRAAILAALAQGTSTITGFLESEDCLTTIAILEQLGVPIEHPCKGTFIIHGTGGKFKAPSEALFCGNSGTTLRLLAGVLATQSFCTALTGDASLSQRPMERIIEPLKAMGASLRTTGNKIGSSKNYLPLNIEGKSLRPICYTLPIASAQVKSALLLAALFCPGETTILEPTPCRDHTERMLASFQVTCSSFYNDQGAHGIRLCGPQQLKACDFHIPGDISSAAFWMVAAAARKGSKLCLENIGLNPTRAGILNILKRMGANITILPIEALGEPFGTIIIEGVSLRGTIIEGGEIPNVIDELPILAIAGALAQGVTIIKDAKELRVKETDRISALVKNLRAMRATVIEHEDGMEIHGGFPLQGTSLPSYGDHRIAMAFAIAGLFAEGKTTIEDTDCVKTSYPDFAITLASMSARNS